MTDDVETKADAGAKAERRPLSLRRSEMGAVKQSFSHGRSKTVVVETKKRRVVGGKKEDEAAPHIEAPKRETAAARTPETKA
ncbi:MAG: translation initiation factor IF-2 associated domain-containing protein, partial [Pseudomonadota bacterium]